MARNFTPKVLTANLLIKGDVVYFGTNGDWVISHSDAHLFEDKCEADHALENAELLTENLVGAYLADAEIQDGKPVPIHFREVFRAHGPSNYHHGKQEL